MGNVTLQLSTDGETVDAPAIGKTYQLFTLPATGISGTFSEILPAVPAEGMAWDTSELYTKGVLKVVEGETDGIGGVNRYDADKAEFFQLSGERVVVPTKGSIYILRTTTDDGRVTTRKVSCE